LKVTTAFGVTTGVGVGVGLGVGGFSITNKGEGVDRVEAGVNRGEADTAMLPATTATIARTKRMRVRMADWEG